MKTTKAILLSTLITLLFVGNFFIFQTFAEESELQSALVTRIIDGDTLEINGQTPIRFANIDTPEKNELGYSEALNFLIPLLNTTIQIEIIEPGKYGRPISRVYTDKYMNLEIIKQGLATKSLVYDSETKLFSEAEEFAISEQNGLWKKSDFAGCISTKINQQDEFVEIKSECGILDFTDWRIKDESRKKYKFPRLFTNNIILNSHNGIDNETDLFWGSDQNVWNNDRDTLYLFDAEGKLVHHEIYGY